VGEALKGLPKDRRRFPLLTRRTRVRVQAGESADPENDPRARGDWERAERDLSEALRGRPWDRDLLWARAEARLRLERHAGAIEDYQAVLKIDDEDGLTRGQLAYAYDQAGKPKEAAAEYDRMVAVDPQDPDLLLRRGLVLAKPVNSQFERAFDDYLAAARQFKSRWRLKEAGPAYDKALALCNKHVKRTREVQAQIHAERGEVHTFLGENKDALKHFTKATGLAPSVWTHWNGRAHSHQRLGEWERAVEASDRALRLGPEDLTLARSRAEALIQLGDWDQAAKAHQALFKRAPKVLSYRLRLAAIYLQPLPPGKPLRPDQWAAASRCLAEAAEAFPNDSVVWMHLAVVHLAAGDVDAYRATRARMLERFQDAGGFAANNVAWASSLAADTPDGSARALDLARKAFSVLASSTAHRNTLGAALYRAGKRKEAIDELTRQQANRFLPPDQVAYEKALNLLLLAMAEYTPEQPGPARGRFRLADEEIKRLNASRQSERPDLSLSRVWKRLEVRILRREAEGLINKR
jgi:tetratricopeptide (TPR) repeat protein